MAIVELYIEGQLADLPGAYDKKLSMNKVLFNPANFNYVDAQSSLSFQLPKTANNNRIFGYINVEEVKGKFKNMRDAVLYVNGVEVFKGVIKLFSIKDTYDVNLIRLAGKSLTDMFGNLTLNQTGKWLLDFNGVEDITNYNTGTYDIQKYGDISPALFPLVLYGVLPKVDEEGLYYLSDENNPDVNFKNTLDKNVRFAVEDFYPSVNCLQMMQNIFKNAGYNLSGSAYNDPRLKNLYVSYRNPDDYYPEWLAGAMKIRGSWTNLSNGSREGKYYVNLNEETPDLSCAVVDIFNSEKVNITYVEQIENDITITEKDGAKNVSFIAPYSGLYKVEFDALITLLDGSYNALRTLEVEPGEWTKKYELKLVRNYQDRDLKNEFFDNTFYLNNIRQDQNSSDKIFPSRIGVNFIDPKQNPEFISGFSFGYDSDEGLTDFYNPLIPGDRRANPMAIRNGQSWSYPETLTIPFSAVKSPSYKYEDGTNADQFEIDLQNAPDTNTRQTGDRSHAGHVSQVVWLDKGDSLTIIDISNLDTVIIPFARYYWQHHKIDFALSVTPFQHQKKWITIDNTTHNSTAPMDWNDNSDFNFESLDLTKFLPSEVKVDEWIENFCKAFNLKVTNVGGRNYELNLRKNDIPKTYSNIIDFDMRGHTSLVENKPLGLPYQIELGFNIENNEEGYYRSSEKDESGEVILNTGETGGGKYLTGGDSTSKLTQTSIFSYTWYKQLYDKDGNPLVKAPVITEYDVWDNDYDYEDVADERFFDLAQRFWYKDSSIDVTLYDKTVKIATVKNEFQKGNDKLILNYKDEPHSIMNEYFLVLADNENCYTVLNVKLKAEEYQNLNNYVAKFNGDLYNIVSIEGYDPTVMTTGVIKLLRKLPRKRLE